MRTMRTSDPALEAQVAYAADRCGAGVAYARLIVGSSQTLLRIVFRVGLPAPFPDRAIAYAALIAVTRALRKRGCREVCFVLEDAEFVNEIATGSGVRESLTLPYVRLRCALNALATFEVRPGPAEDLAQRARAEVALNVAA
jgi:hypothetical protein